jgi:hypothetical protein
MRVVGERCAGVSSLRWVAFFLVVLLVVAFAATGQEDPKPFGGELPLWEPYWSPHLLSFGGFGTPDSVNAFCFFDIFWDQNPELIIGGDVIHTIGIIEGDKVCEEYPHLGDRFGVSDVREKLLVGDMACGDLDGDGAKDLVVRQREGLQIFLNKRRWGLELTPESPYRFAGRYPSVIVVDYTQDGAPDVVLAGGEGGLVYPGDGKGGLEEAFQLSGVEGRFHDLAAGVYEGNFGLWMLTTEGLWFFPAGERAGVKVQEDFGRGLTVADFDGDGVLDLAIGRIGSKVEVLLSKQGGEYASQVVDISLETGWDFQVDRVASGDLNGDEWPDLVAIQNLPAELVVIYNLGQGHFEKAYRYEVQDRGEIPNVWINPERRPQIDEVLIADVTRDGQDDVVLSIDAFFLTVFTARATPEGRCFQHLAGGALLGTCDIDGDGTLEILREARGGGVATLYNKGAGLFAYEDLVSAPPDSEEIWWPDIARLADLDGDSVLDLLVWGHTATLGAQVLVWHHDVGEDEWSFGWRFVLLGDSPVLREVLTPDLDDDGKSEVVLSIGSEVVILEETGNSPEAQLLEENRIDIGGEVDLLEQIIWRGKDAVIGFRRDADQQATRVVLISGNEVIESNYIYQAALRDAISCDLNLDGYDDLVFTALIPVEEGAPGIVTYGLWSLENEELRPFAVEVVVLVGAANGEFEEETFLMTGWPEERVPFGCRGMVAGDFNGDGRIDLATAVTPPWGNPGGVVVITQNEDGFAPPIFIEAQWGDQTFAVDLNGDGTDEIVLDVITRDLCLLSWSRQ